MVDYHSNLVEALKTVLPTHYELTLTKDTKTPCITYLEGNNYAVEEGNTIGYSRLQYIVKVWGHEIAQLQAYSLHIDAVLRPLGFKRISSGELYDRNSTMIQKILNYEALALEQF